MFGRISSDFRNGPVVLVSDKIQFTFPLAYGYLAGYLKAKGEDVRILFRPPSSEYHTFVRQIVDLNPLLVGVGSLYPDLLDIKTFVQMLNDAGRCFPIVIGGQMVTPIPKFAAEITGADIGVLGEGEITLHRLVTALREGKHPATVKGLVVRAGDEYIFTGQGEFIDNLNNLPGLPYDLFPLREWLCIGRYYARYVPHPHWRFNDRVINVHGGRGCPFSCNFCYHHSKPRYRQMDTAMAEASEAVERFNGNMLYFSDETTLPSPQRVRQMLDEIKKLPRRIEYSVSSRFDILNTIDDNLLMEMKETGCRIMGLGIESGSDRILKIIGKHYSADTVRRGLERLNKAGILPTVSIMVGQYTETREEAELSIALMKESVRSNRNIQYSFSYTTPFPGSELYNLIFQKGYLRNDREFYDLYFKNRKGFNYVVNLSGMSDEELRAMYEKIYKVYNEERIRANRQGVMQVEFMMRATGYVNEIIDTKIFAKIRRNPVLKKIFCVDTLDKLRHLTYDFLQTRLDNLRLRLRGIFRGHR